MDKDIFQYLIRVCYIRPAIKILYNFVKLTFSISLHKISVFKKYVWLSLVKIHPVQMEKYPEIIYSVHDLIIKIPN